MTAASSIDITAPPAAREFVRYLACSLLALVVDTGLYHLSMRFGLNYPLAAIVGFLGGLSTAYLISIRWAFRERSVSNPALEFVIFAGVGIAGLGLTEALLWIQIEQMQMGPLVAKILAAGAVCLFNFGARKALLFTRIAPIVGKSGAAA